MRNFLKGQNGVGMIMVIAFMGLSLPLIMGALSLAGTLSVDSQVKTQILKRQYSGLGCDQYAWFLVRENLPPGTYPCGINGDTTDINITDVPTIVGPPPPADDSRRLQTSKTVSPTTAPADTMTTFVYSLTVVNRDDDPENLTKIHDLLPTDFTYVAGTTSGITTDEPAISGQQLTWDLGAMSLVLNPGDSVDLTFWAEAEVPDGNYCNEAWAEPGNLKTSTGKTALIQVGSASGNLCTGAAVKLTKSVEVERGTFPAGTPQTYTYTIAIENTGTSDLTLSQIRDLLAPNFFYVNGTTNGTLTTADPNAVIWNGSQRLDWVFSPAKVIPSGTTETLTFDMQGSFGGGHWNQVWLTLAEFADPIYSWPVAGVEVIDATETTSTTPDGGVVYSLIWQIASDSYVLWQWEFSGP